MTPFILCFEAHREDGLVWALLRSSQPHDDGAWEFYRQVHLACPVNTVYRGPRSPQPVAYVTGSAAQIQIVDDVAIVS